MKPNTAIVLSVLDLASVREGGTVAESFRNTFTLAQHAEKWGWRERESGSHQSQFDTRVPCGNRRHSLADHQPYRKRQISRFHHHIGNNYDIAITPYVKFGEDNQIVLFGGANAHTVKNVSLEYYAKGTYP